MEDYMDVKKYIDNDNKKLKVKITVDNSEINYLVINRKGDVVADGEVLTKIIKTTLPSGKVVKKKEIIKDREQYTFYNSQLELNSLNVGQEPNVRHKGAKDEITNYYPLNFKITKIEKFEGNK